MTHLVHGVLAALVVSAIIAAIVGWGWLSNRIADRLVPVRDIDGIPANATVFTVLVMGGPIVVIVAIVAAAR